MTNHSGDGTPKNSVAPQWLRTVAVTVTAGALLFAIPLLTSLKVSVEAIESDRDYIDVLQGKVPLIEDSANRLEKTVEGLDATIKTLNGNMVALTASISTLSTKVTGLEKSIKTDEPLTVTVQLEVPDPDKSDDEKLVYYVELDLDDPDRIDRVLRAKWWNDSYPFASLLVVDASWARDGSNRARIEIRAFHGTNNLLKRVVQSRPSVDLVLSEKAP